MYSPLCSTGGKLVGGIGRVVVLKHMEELELECTVIVDVGIVFFWGVVWLE